MKPRMIVTDWNRTLIKYENDKPVLNQIVMDELFHCLKHASMWKRAWNLLGLKFRLDRMVKQYDKDPESQAELLKNTYELYNSEIVYGMPMERIHKSLNKYAVDAVKGIDYPTFNAVCCANNKNNNNIPVNILTSALDIGVEQVLRRMKCNDGGAFEFGVYGTTVVEENDKAKKVNLSNYDDRPEMLQRIVGSQTEVVYMGDDFRDEACLDIVKIFVVPPLATEEFRNKMANYGNKVRTPEKDSESVYRALILV